VNSDFGRYADVKSAVVIDFEFALPFYEELLNTKLITECFLKCINTYFQKQRENELFHNKTNINKKTKSNENNTDNNNQIDKPLIKIEDEHIMNEKEKRQKKIENTDNPEYLLKEESINVTATHKKMVNRVVISGWIQCFEYERQNFIDVLRSILSNGIFSKCLESKITKLRNNNNNDNKKNAKLSITDSDNDSNETKHDDNNDGTSNNNNNSNKNNNNTNNNKSLNSSIKIIVIGCSIKYTSDIHCDAASFANDDSLIHVVSLLGPLTRSFTDNH